MECARLKRLWAEKKSALGLTQQKIADAIGSGVTQGAVSHYLNGQNALNLEVALIFSRALEVSVEEFSPRLYNEIAHVTEESWRPNVVDQVIRGWLPLISYVQAGQWSETVDLYEPGYAEQTLPTSVKHSPQTFALRVDGDSMTLPQGVDGRSFPHGIIIYVDPNRECQVGDYVIARRVGSQKATFKRLMSEEGVPVLVPLHPNRDMYPIIRDEFELIGRVIDASWGGF